MQQNRAIAKGFNKDTETYHKAITRCLELLLEASPELKGRKKGAGKLPLHLAIKNSTLLVALSHCP
jgi:hypothetical protein